MIFKPVQQGYEKALMVEPKPLIEMKVPSVLPHCRL
nr:MAG TPA: hypothetical protein [Caudoviricetes sp.]